MSAKDGMDKKWEEIKPRYVRDLLSKIDDLSGKNGELKDSLKEVSSRVEKANKKISDLSEEVKQTYKELKDERGQHYSAISIYAKLRDEEPGYWWALDAIKKREECQCQSKGKSVFRKCTKCLASSALDGEENSIHGYGPPYKKAKEPTKEVPDCAPQVVDKEVT